MDPNQTPNAFGQFMIFLPVVLVVVFIMFSSLRAQKKEKKQKEELIQSLKKGQKVTTIGGIIGTVREVTGNEVVLVVDSKKESTLTVLKASVSSIDSGEIGG